MTHTLFLLTAYLFVGALFTLFVNEVLLDGMLTQKEFVAGMLCWPVVFVYGICHIGRTYVRRIFSRG